MIKLKDLINKICINEIYRNAILYLGWVNTSNLNVIGFDIQSGEDETHHNYLMGLPPEWRNERDVNLKRWRYRNDMNVVYWWDFGKPTDEEKKSVEDWLKSNLRKINPDHRIIPTSRDNMNFYKSHGED